MTHQQIVVSVVGVGVMLLVAGYIYDDQPHPGPVPLSERCSKLGGEWLYKSADLLCLMPDGGKLAYSPTADEFEPYAKAGGVLVVADSTETRSVGSCESIPEFSDYSTNESFNGRPQVDFSTNQAATKYRTAITKDVARGVNFAGEYVVSTWGCGSGCQGAAVINAETGKILAYGLTSSGFEFKDDSRLFVTNDDGVYQVVEDVFMAICE